MSNNSSTMTLVVDIVGKVDNIQNAIKQIQNGLGNIQFGNGREKDLLNQITSIGRELENIKKRASGGLTGGQMTTELKKVQGFSNELNNIIRTLNKVSNKPLQMIDTAAMNNIRKAEQELNSFAKTYKQVSDSRSGLESNFDKATAALTKANDELEKFKSRNGIDFDIKNIGELQSELDQAKKSLEGMKEGSEAFNVATENVQKLKNQLDILRFTDEATGKTVKSTWSSLISDINNAERQVNKYKNALDQLNNSQISDFVNKIKELYNINLSGNSIEELKESLKNISVEEISKVAPTLQDIIASAGRASNGMHDVASSFRDAGDQVKYMKQVNSEMDQLANRLTYFFSAASMINVVVRSLRNAFSVIQELDKAMTETAVVTNYTVADMWKQLPKYTKTANELGATTKGAYETMTLFFQQGLDQAQAFQLGTETMKMARIAGLDYAEATDRMTNALRGFNMELNDVSSQRVNDVYSNLAAKSASNVDELSTAMTKTASIAHAANMEFETTAAFLAQIIETTRESAETAGTALKTVIARFSEVKKLYSEGELTGQDEEGEEIDVNRVSTALRAAGVDLNEYLTGAKGLDEVFIELASKWDSLDLITQRYIATMAAGSRQQSRFIALMQDYERQTELVSIAENAAGASQEQFAKTLDSLEAKLNQLSNAWNEFTMHLMDSSFLKGIIDGLTAVVEGINKLIDATGGFGVALAGLGAILGAKFVASVVGRFANTLKTSFMASGAMAAQSFGQGFKNQVPVFSTSAKIAAKEAYQSFHKEISAGRSKDGNLLLKDFTKITNSEKNQGFLNTKGLEGVKQAVSEATLSGVNNGLNSVGAKGNPGWLRSFNLLMSNNKDFNFGETIAANIEANGGNISAAVRDAVDQGIAATGSQIKGKSKETLIANVTKTIEENGVVDESKIKNIGDSFNSVTQGANAAAGAIFNLANQLDQLGLHSTASALRTLGGLFQTFGSIVVAVGFVIKKVGVEVMATWWPLIAIMGAVVAAIAIFNAINWNNSIEKRVQDLEGALKGVEQAAKNAKQAYDDALSNKSNYSEIIKTMDSLVKGTDEWVQKLLEANQVILDIIAKNPEMAKYMTTNADTGALEFTDQGWSDYIKTLQETATQSAQAQLGLQANLNLANNEKTKKDFIEANQFSTFYANGESAFFDLGQMIYDALKEGSIITAQTVKEELSSQGLITNKTDEEIADLIIEANGLLQQENATLVENKALLQQRFKDEFNGDTTLQNAATRMGLSYSSKDTKAQIQQFYKDGDWSEDANRKKLAASYGITFSDANDELKQLQEFYVGLYGGTIDEIEEGLKEDKDKLAEAINAYISGDQIVKGINKALRKSKLSKEISKSFMGMVDGTSLTPKQVKDLRDQGIELGKITEDTLKEIFGENTNLEQLAKDLGYESVTSWLDGLNKGGQEAADNEAKVRTNLSKIFTGQNQEKQTSDFLDSMSNASYETQNKLIDKLLATESTSGLSLAGDSLFNQIEQITERLGDEKGTKFLEQLAAIDWSDLSTLQGFSEDLKQLGIVGDDIDYLTQCIIDFNNATHNVSLDTLVSNVQELNKIGAKIQTGEQGSSFDSETYETLIGAIPSLSKDFQYDYIADKYIYLGDSMATLQSAIEANTKALLQQKIDSLNDQIQSGTYLKNNWNNKLEAATSGKYSDFQAKQVAIGVFKSLKEQGSNFEGISGFSKDTTLGLAQAIFDDSTKTQEFLSEALGLLNNIATNTTELEGLKNEVATNQMISEGYQNGYSAGPSAITPTNINGTTPSNTTSTVSPTSVGLTGQGTTVGELEEYNRVVETAFKQIDNYDAKLKQVKEDHKELNGILSEGQWKALTVDIDKATEKTKKLTEAFEKNYEALKDTSSDGYQDAFKELNSSLAEMYGSDVFDEGGDFLKDNIDDILSYAETGSEETLSKIQTNIAAKQLTIDLGLNADDAIDVANDVASQIDDWSAEIDIYGYADVTNVITQFGYAQEQIAAAAAAVEAITGMQVVGEVQYKSIPAFENYSPIGHESDTISYAQYVKYRLVRGTPQSSGISNIKAPKSSGGGGGGGGGGDKKDPKEDMDWKNPYDELYNSYAKLEELQRKRNHLEKEYNLLIDTAGASYKTTNKYLEDQLKNLEDQRKVQNDIIAGKKKQISEIKDKTYEVENGQVKTFASAFADAMKESNKISGTTFSNNLTDYAWYDTDTEQMHIEWDKIDALEGKIDSTTGAILEAYVSELEGLEDQLEEATDALDDIAEETKAIIDNQLQNRIDFVESMREAMINSMQKNIDKLSTLNETINESNSKIFDSIQEQIDLERQIRDNTKKEDDIAKNEARLAYLRRDTSGANDLEIQKLEQTLADQRESYSDQLVDQELSRLQDQADKAAEQRERQIDIMEKQLDYYEKTGYFSKEIDQGLTKTQALDYFKDWKNFDAATEAEKIKILEDFNALWNKGSNKSGTAQLAAADNMYQGQAYTIKDDKGKVVGKNATYDVTTDTWKDEKGNTYKATDIASADILGNTITLKKKEEPKQEPQPNKNGNGASGDSKSAAKKEEAPKETYPHGKASAGSRLLKKKSPLMTGEDVKAVQYALNKLGFTDNSGNALKVDGQYGDKTKAAVKKFQKAMGISDDGIVGSDTRKQFKAKGYSTGGLADYTGPAWLHGSKSKPEMVLNAKDTENFIQLKDTLADVAKGSKNGSSGGDNYFDIKVEVGEIGSDYDVEKMIDKIKDEINQDARYRNVNSINFIR